MASSTPLRVGRLSRLTDDRLTSPLAAASILLALCCNAHQASAQSDAKRGSTSAATNGASADALPSDENAAERQERIAGRQRRWDGERASYEALKSNQTTARGVAGHTYQSVK